MFKLIQREFQAWFDAKPDDAPIGISCKPGQCGLANFIWETFRISSLVSGNACYAPGYPEGTPLDHWAKIFVYHFDSIPDDLVILDEDGNRVVTKANWLLWKERLKQEEESDL